MSSFFPPIKGQGRCYVPSLVREEGSRKVAQDQREASPHRRTRSSKVPGKHRHVVINKLVFPLVCGVAVVLLMEGCKGEHGFLLYLLLGLLDVLIKRLRIDLMARLGRSAPVSQVLYALPSWC